MKKYEFPVQLYLRLALASGFLKLGLDRLGAWGNNGSRFVSWGDWKHFMQYANEVLGFLPSILIEPFAIAATTAEILFGILLMLGKWTRYAAMGSGILTLLFAMSMAISNGIQDPIGYSVFTVSAASFLLATIPRYQWSIDDIRSIKRD